MTDLRGVHKVGWEKRLQGSVREIPNQTQQFKNTKFHSISTCIPFSRHFDGQHLPIKYRIDFLVSDSA